MTIVIVGFPEPTVAASRCHGLWQMYSTVHHIGDVSFSLIHPHSRELTEQSYFVTKNIIVIILVKLLYLQYNTIGFREVCDIFYGIIEWQ